MSKTFSMVNENVCIRLKLFGEEVRQLLEKNGWQEKKVGEASRVFMNSCNFLERIEQKTLERIKKTNQSLREDQELIVFGCLPVTAKNKLKKVHSGGYAAGSSLERFAKRIGLKMYSIKPGHVVKRKQNLTCKTIKWFNRFFLKDAYFTYLYDKCKVFHLKISDGCLGKCTFCSERFARGELKSKPVKKVIEEFKKGLSKGYKVFSLNADDTGVYGWDNDETIVELLDSLLSHDQKFHLVITEFNPLALERFDELEELLNSKKIALITVPIQSGSKKILKKMGRDYTPKIIVKKLNSIRDKNPNLKFNTHVIVGFPGETRRDFEKTMRLFDEVIFDKAKIFQYSERPGTPASRMNGKVCERVKLERQKKLKQKIVRRCVKQLDLKSLLLNTVSPQN